MRSTWDSVPIPVLKLFYVSDAYVAAPVPADRLIPIPAQFPSISLFDIVAIAADPNSPREPALLAPVVAVGSMAV